jgi:hypothetical protein
VATSDGSNWEAQSTSCHAAGDGGVIPSNPNVPAQPAGRGFGLTAGPLPVLGSAELSWTIGTEQSGYHIVRLIADSDSLVVSPHGKAPLPAPAQSLPGH